MKVQEYLSAYLYQHKQLILQGIGHFTLDRSFMRNESEREAWPENAIRFEYDMHAGVDPSLIDYLSQQTGKMKTLAMADLDSYLSSGREMLNIGKPFYIIGVGWLQKTQQQQFTFEQTAPIAHSEVPGSEHENYIKDRTKDKDEGELSFDFSYRTPKKNAHKSAASIAVLLMVIVFGLAGYFFIWPWLNTPENNPEPVVAPAVESNQRPLPAETTSVEKADQLEILLDTFHNKRGALKRYEQLKSYGHNVVLETADSLNFELKLILQQPVANEEKLKDSLSRLFGKPIKTP